ncbi:MAG TPA: DUF1206 domain-containing protein [Mycobacteriales bacterium]|nr:DUF1206 domain-containing protein [Mycobacteriales bacterium]
MRAKTKAGVRRRARRTQRSAPVGWAARFGMVGRSALWVTMAILTLQVAIGGSARTDQEGALRAIADRPLGELLLVLMAVGLVAFAGHQAITAGLGGPRGRRLKAGAKALLYAAVAALTVRFLVVGPSEGDQTASLAARLMDAPGGRVLVGAVGLVVVAIAVVTGYEGLRSHHEDRLDPARLPGRWRARVIKAGVVGILGRSLVVGLVGGFLLRAAVLFDPAEAKGLDAALQTLRDQSYGVVLLVLAASSMLAYAIWSTLEAAFRRL